MVKGELRLLILLPIFGKIFIRKVIIRSKDTKHTELNNFLFAVDPG